MYGSDESDFTFAADGSRLFSESSLMASESASSHIESTHQDLSLPDLSAKAHEEKLQNDIFILKKLNAVFSAFNEALDATGGINGVWIFISS